MPRLFWWIAIPFALLVIVALFVLPPLLGGKEGDPIARAAALLGILLVLGNFGWDAYKFAVIRREKEESERERVRLVVHVQDVFETGPALVARVHNPCPFTIPIRSVSLHCDQPTTNELGEPSQRWRVFPFMVQERLPEIVGSIDIPPRTGIRFMMHGRLQRFFSEDGPMIGPNSYVSVCSHAGEIARFEGDELIRMLHQLLEFLRGNRPGEPPSPPGDGPA
jgi:hypothetical protein